MVGETKERRLKSRNKRRTSEERGIMKVREEERLIKQKEPSTVPHATKKLG